MLLSFHLGEWPSSQHPGQGKWFLLLIKCLCSPRFLRIHLFDRTSSYDLSLLSYYWTVRHGMLVFPWDGLKVSGGYITCIIREMRTCVSRCLLTELCPHLSSLCCSTVASPGVAALTPTFLSTKPLLWLTESTVLRLSECSSHSLVMMWNCSGWLQCCVLSRCCLIWPYSSGGSPLVSETLLAPHWGNSQLTLSKLTSTSMR